MKRTLQITVLIIGILLIIISAEMTRQRDNHAVNDILLMTAIRNGQDSVYLVGADRDNGAWRAVGPKYVAFTPKGRSPDGKWVYLMESTYSNPRNIPYAENMRVRTNGTRAERLAGVTISGPMFWSGEWVYYQFYDTTTNQSELYRAKADGSQVENLTANFQWQVNVYEYSPPVFDPNGAWVIFNASDLNGQSGVFRLDLVTRQITSLVPQSPNYVTLLGTSRDGSWLVLQMGDLLYHMRVNGSDLEPIFDNRGGFANMWSHANLAMATVYHGDGTTTLFAIHVIDARIMWSIPNAYFDSPPDVPHLFIRDNQNWLYEASADGTPPRRVVQISPYAYSSAQSPSGRLLLLTETVYDGVDPYKVSYILWLVRDGALVELYRNTDAYITVAGWSKDESAVFVEIYNNYKRDLWRIDVATGHKTRLIHDGQYGYFLGVVDERKWDAWACVPIGGLGLIGAGVGSWVWGRRRRGIEFPG